jgi:hypothetical protein
MSVSLRDRNLRISCILMTFEAMGQDRLYYGGRIEKKAEEHV